MVYIIRTRDNDYRSAGDYDLERGWFRDYDNNFIFRCLNNCKLFKRYACIGKLINGNLEPLSDEDKQQCHTFGWELDDESYNNYMWETMVKGALDD